MSEVQLPFAPEEDRKLNRLIYGLGLEPLAARLPHPMRIGLARWRYGWIDQLVELRAAPQGDQGLAEADALNTIFVHIPKTGGISVAEGLFGNHAAAHASVYSYLALYGAAEFDRMFKFAFVRNPWGRLISAYHFLKAGGLTETDRAFAEAHLAEYEDINDFVARGFDAPAIQTWVHFQPQTNFLRDPRTGRIGVDYLGRFESIAEDYARVTERLGVTRPLPHKNKGTSKPKAGPGLTPASVKRIGEFYHQDVVALDYAPPEDLL